MSANQVLGMMPTPAGIPEQSGPNAGGSYSAAESDRGHGAEGGGSFSLPGAAAARTHRTSNEAAA